jgi:hypothetical protein
LPKRKLNKPVLATACELEKTTSETTNAGNIIFLDIFFDLLH